MKQSTDMIARKAAKAITTGQKRGFKDSRTLGLMVALALSNHKTYKKMRKVKGDA